MGKNQSPLLAYSYDPVESQRRIPDITWVHPTKQTTEVDVILEELRRPSTPFCFIPIHLRDLKRLLDQKLVLCLDKRFSKAELAKYALQGLELCKMQGELYAIPEDFKPSLFFARKDLLADEGLKPATDLQELVDHLSFLQKKHGTPPFIVQGGGPYARLGTLCSILGAHGVNLSGTLEEFASQKEKLIEAYEWTRRLQTQNLIMDFDFFLRKINPRSGPDFFRDGKVFYFLSWPGIDLTSWPANFHEQIELMEFPPSHPGVETFTPMSGHAWIIPANVQDTAAAVSALKKTQARDLLKQNELKKGAPFHACQEIWDDPEILEKIPFYRHAHLLKKIKNETLLTLNERKFELLDESFRQAMLDGLSGEEWIKKFIYREYSATRQLAKNQIIQEAVEYIEKNLAKIEGTDQVAVHFQLSPRYFNRLFRKEMGMGCGTWLLQVRMEHARNLMKDQVISLKEIAAKVGYKHPSYFTQAFRRHFGITPSEMIRKNA